MTVDLNEEVPSIGKVGKEEICEEFDVDRRGECIEDRQREVPIDCDTGMKEEFLVEDSNKFHNSIRLELEKSLEVGAVIESLDHAYILYCEYGRMMGFSVKKGQQNYFRRGEEVKMKLYLCSCEGMPDPKASQSKVACYKKQVWRTNCKARLRVSRMKDGPWIVSCFHKVHNHDLLALDQSYLLRSARHLSHAKLSVVAALNSAGIGVTKAFRFMTKESGGIENVGFIRKDAYNSIGRARRESKIQNVDAQRVLEFFDKKATEDPLFRSSVQLDDDGRLMNFFYRDARCALDYNHFGDVLSIDTTHKTNKYNLLCAPFVGMNHHRQNIMFGVAFLSDETTKSFEWLFSTFLLHMGMQEPKVVFSDEAQALINGIDYTFQTAKHRLCQWHINQNSGTHFGSLNGDFEFKKTWYHCMNGCETEEEFEESWTNMIEKYNLSEVNWFRKMYNIKRRWSSVFSIDRFSAGLHSTSRSEGTNNALKALCSSSTCLYDFVMQYEQVQTDWRNRERAQDAVCIGLPGQIVLNNPLLIHAARVYTRQVFNLFEREFTEAANVYIHEHPTDYSADELVFVVRVTGRRKARQVIINKSLKRFECSCCKFVTDGYFCNHLINIMLMLNIREIPKAYILKRWTKCAKMKIEEQAAGGNSGESGLKHDIFFVNHVMRFLYDIAVSCKDESQKIDVKEALSLLKSKICPPSESEVPSPTVKFKGRPPMKVNGVLAKNPTMPKPKPRVSPRSKYLTKSKKRAVTGAKNKNDTARKKKCVADESHVAPSSQREELSASIGDCGLDFLSSQAFGCHVTSVPFMPNTHESRMKDEDVRLTL